MLATIARKSLDLYTLPARAAYRQTRRNLAAVRRVRDAVRQQRQQQSELTDQLIHQLGRQLGLDTSRLTREQRLHKARAALANVEYGLSMALSEGAKALVLMAVKDDAPKAPPRPGRVIEGEVETPAGR